MTSTSTLVDRIAYSPTGAATVTGRSRSRIFLAIKNKELTARKDGRATLLEASELERWIKSLPVAGQTETAAA
jgi:excisionase family DNA binding protein